MLDSFGRRSHTRGTCGSYVGVVEKSFNHTEGDLSAPSSFAAQGVFAASVEMSLNGAQFSGDGHTYFFVEGPAVEEFSPISTGLAGGTIVTVRGTGFQDFPTLWCKFGMSTIVPATRISMTRLHCESPSIGQLLPKLPPKQALDARFLHAPPQLLLGGFSRVDGGVLKLTDDVVVGRTDAGWVISNLPAPVPALLEWEVDFELFIGGGAGGEGISFLYGNMAEYATLVEHGGLTAFGPPRTLPFDGLVISFRTHQNSIHISYSGSLHQFTVCTRVHSTSQHK